jgi:hypothetical protein
VPRDAYVDLPDHLGRTTIDGAFGLAKLATAGKLRTQGVNKVQIGRDCVTVARRATRQVIEDLTGVTIEVNLLSFYEISKAVAGVEPEQGRRRRELGPGLPRWDTDRTRSLSYASGTISRTRTSIGCGGSRRFSRRSPRRSCRRGRSPTRRRSRN